MTGQRDDATRNANVALLFEQSAARRCDEAALVDHDGRVLWRFGELAEASARMAGGLVGLGIGRGDPVVVLEQDRRQLFLAVAAVIWAGGSVVLPPASMPIRSALEAASGCRPRAVLTSLGLWPVAAAYAGLRRAPIRVVNGPLAVPGWVRAGEVARQQPIAPRNVAPEHRALVSFTSGTTGPSKRVARSHGVLRAQHHALGALRSLTDADRDFTGLPMIVLNNLASGVTSILSPREPASSHYGRRIREAIVRAGATAAAGFPHQLQSAALGARPGELAGLRAIHVGGDRVRPRLLEALAVVAPAADCTVVYGSTEIEPISAIDARSYLQLYAASDPAGGICVGRLVDGLELRIEPWPDEASLLPDRPVRGRIVLRGPHASGSAATDGWVDTGDVGRIGDDGHLWLLGRATNTVRGLYPGPIEQVIEGMPWVERAAFVRTQRGQHVAGVLAVQPRQWGGPFERAERLAELERTSRDMGWVLDATLLLERLPLSRGPGAKVDDHRIRTLGSSRKRRIALKPGSAWR